MSEFLPRMQTHVLYIIRQAKYYIDHRTQFGNWPVPFIVKLVFWNYRFAYGSIENYQLVDPPTFLKKKGNHSLFTDFILSDFQSAFSGWSDQMWTNIYPNNSTKITCWEKHLRR